MTDAITLRPAQPEDEAFLMRVYGETRSEEMALVPWDESEKRAFLEMQYRAQRDDYTRRFPASEHSVVMVGEVAVGRIWVDRRGDEIRLLDIAILAERRNEGTGRVLLGRLQNEARSAGLPLRHSVDKGNVAGLRLYESLGFTIVEDWELRWLMEWIPD